MFLKRFGPREGWTRKSFCGVYAAKDYFVSSLRSGEATA